jgi:hypothetical protein
MKFNRINHVITARDNLRAAQWAGAPKGDLAELANTYDQERRAYSERGKKVAIQNIQQEGDTLLVDVRAVPFVNYNELVGETTASEAVALGRLASLAEIVRTADNRLIIQHRSIKNASYPGIPGASVGGLLDVSFQWSDRKPGTPDPIDTTTIKTQASTETNEELGLAEADIKARIVGLTVDKLKPHDVFLLFAESSLTAQQIAEKARHANKNRKLGDADFEEKFVDIEASPEAIKTLLTQVRCPLAPDHSAAFVAAGYTMLVQDPQKGLEAATAWMADLETGIKENYAQINKVVREYYREDPQRLTPPERFSGRSTIPERNPEGYVPGFTPEEQGLPSFDAEMRRVGLIQ